PPRRRPPRARDRRPPRLRARARGRGPDPIATNGMTCPKGMSYHYTWQLSISRRSEHPGVAAAEGRAELAAAAEEDDDPDRRRHLAADDRQPFGLGRRHREHDLDPAADRDLDLERDREVGA